MEYDQEAKTRNIEQWTRIPCGTSTVNGRAGTKEFFEKALKYRYETYAPWLKKIIFNHLTEVRNKKVLEVGCGWGADLLQFAGLGAHCYGVDLTPQHVKLAKKLFKLYEKEAVIETMDAEKLEYGEETFDLVYSHGVLHHIPNIRKALKEIYRVLKTNGKSIIMVYNKHSLAYYLKVLLYHGLLKGKLFFYSINEILSQVIEEDSKNTKPYVRVYAKKEFIKLAEECGFKIEKAYLKHLMNEKRRNSLRYVVPNNILNFFEGKMGWYLVMDLRK